MTQLDFLAGSRRADATAVDISWPARERELSPTTRFPADFRVRVEAVVFGDALVVSVSVVVVEGGDEGAIFLFAVFKGRQIG